MIKTTPFVEFIRYSFFSIMGMIAISCYILADTFFVAQGIGTNGLAALNLAIPVYDFIHGTGLMLGMGGATKFTILKSQNNKKGADQIFTNTVYLGVFFLPFVYGGRGFLCRTDFHHSRCESENLADDDHLFEGADAVFPQPLSSTISFSAL